MRQTTSGTGATVALRASVALILTVAAFVVAAVYAPDGAFLWVKSLHVVAVISWMAGLLYLPRLFVNHVGLAVGSPESELLKGMERRLVSIIMTPAMVLSWIAGLWLGWVGFRFGGGWLHGKILAVVLLTIAHLYLMRSVRQFANDANRHSGRFWRMANEIPAVLMIVIVVLVVVKPF
jgi:putative membrane protein